FAGMILIDTEDDRLRKSITLTKKVAQVARNRLGSRPKCNDALEVLGLILVVRNWSAVAIDFVSTRAPAGRVPFCDHPMDAIRREEAVVNALPQAVLVDRVSEVQIRVSVVIA